MPITGGENHEQASHFAEFGFNSEVFDSCCYSYDIQQLQEHKGYFKNIHEERNYYGSES